MREEDGRYEAVRSRDARFDGEFFFGVATTGIYCRPSCPATTPHRRNVRFFPSAAAAQASGFRACRRCRPDAVPGSAAWNVRADLVGRAMRLIGDGVVDREGVAGLAERLGYSTRQLQRQLTAELGAGPIALARAQRAHTARLLLQTTDMAITQVAFAAGFASVRRFNETIRELYGCTPRELRAIAPGGDRARTSSMSGGTAPKLRLRLAYRGPYAAGPLFDLLERHAIEGVEEITGDRGDRTYRRTLRLPYGVAVAKVRERTGDGWLDCGLRLTEPRDLTTAIQRLRRLFDLDADPHAVAQRLAAGPVLAGSVARHPGLRVPGAVDPHEAAVRAILEQGTPVADARRLGAALVRVCGRPLPSPDGALTHLFPAMPQVAASAESLPALTRTQVVALRSLGAALAEGRVVLDAGADRDAEQAALSAVEGIGPCTAGHIRQRALGDPDVLVVGDPIVDAAMAAAGVTAADAEHWRPWRSYAMHHLAAGPVSRPPASRSDGRSLLVPAL